MKIEDQVLSYELSEKLKDIGIKQESLFYWYKNPYDGWIIINKDELSDMFTPGCVGINSAFTVSELFEMLLFSIEEGYRKIIIKKIKTGIYHSNPEKMLYFIEYRYVDHVTEDENLSDALAKMLIYLIENKLMEIPK
jgi:hypothetical protein